VTRCPDCFGHRSRRGFAHDPTCPLGLALAAVIKADRDWFKRHRSACHYHRPIKPAEVQELLAMGYEDAREMTAVEVIEYAPGIRDRRPYNDAGLGIAVEDYDREEARRG
jgi:hypothetical protein